MTLHFHPIRFVKSAQELSNLASSSQDTSSSQEIENSSTAIISYQQETGEFVKSTPAQLSGEEAKAFYESLFSENWREFSPENSASTSTNNLNQFLKLASDGDLANIQKYLKKHPSLLNSQDDSGWSALMHASFKGRTNIVDYLLGNGADHSLTNGRNRSALTMARRRGHKSVVDSLLKAERGEFRRVLILDSDSDDEIAEIYCRVCEGYFRDPSHETSTVHLLKSAPTGEANDRPSYLLPQSNKGYQLMLKEGWDVNKGLGREGQGRWYPVKTVLKRDRKGLGSLDAPKPRVTHFAPNDARAIQKQNDSNRNLKLEGNLTKKQMAIRESEKKEWIKRFRREFY